MEKIRVFNSIILLFIIAITFQLLAATVACVIGAIMLDMSSIEDPEVIRNMADKAGKDMALFYFQNYSLYVLFSSLFAWFFLTIWNHKYDEKLDNNSEERS